MASASTVSRMCRALGRRPCAASGGGQAARSGRGRDGDATEIQSASGIEVEPQLALNRHLDQDAGRIKVADIEDHHRPSIGGVVVDRLDHLVGKCGTGAATSRVEADGQLPAIILDYASDRGAFAPDLAVRVGLLPHVGPEVAFMLRRKSSAEFA